MRHVAMVFGAAVLLAPALMSDARAFPPSGPWDSPLEASQRRTGAAGGFVGAPLAPPVIIAPRAVIAPPAVITQRSREPVFVLRCADEYSGTRVGDPDLHLLIVAECHRPATRNATGSIVSGYR